MDTAVIRRHAADGRARAQWGWKALPFLFVLLALPALAGCKYNQSEYRFRMTVEVETPRGLKTGSSVYEAGAADRVHVLSEEAARDLWSHGEAVAVEVAPGKVLFALLKTHAHFEDMATLSMEALDPRFPARHDIVGSAARIAQREGVRSSAVVDPAIYPMLVTFRDIDDPTTVKLVNPDDLAATFGKGFRLKRITVQLTDDPVTMGIEKRLGWLSAYRDQTFAGNRYAKDNSLADSLAAGYFSTEVE